MPASGSWRRLTTAIEPECGVTDGVMVGAFDGMASAGDANSNVTAGCRGYSALERR